MLKNQALHKIMAEEIYFIKPNPVVAKINLYHKLCNEEDNFLRFLNADKQVNLEIIKNKLQDSIETLSSDELRQLFDWFKFQYNSATNDEVKTQLYINGIDLFHEIPSAPAKMYDNILNDYEKVNQCDLQYISEADQLNKFLLYGLFYTSFTQEVNTEKRILIDYLKTQHTTIYDAAQAEFKEKTNQANFTEDLNTSGIVLFDSFSELYDSTKFYKGSIIQLTDS